MYSHIMQVFKLRFMKKDILLSSFHYLRDDKTISAAVSIFAQSFVSFCIYPLTRRCQLTPPQPSSCEYPCFQPPAKILRLVHPKKIDLAKLLEVDLAGVVLVVEENCLVHNLKQGRR